MFLLKISTLFMFHSNFRDWDEQLWMQIFLILINGAEQINLLINHLQQILSEPSFLEQLDAAILRKEDLLMEDD